MTLAVEFTRFHSYTPDADGISLPVVLESAGEKVKVLAYVDTGASNCFFERRYAELLNVDVESGDRKTFRTATGRVDAFGHLIMMEILDLKFESVVYFFEDERIDKNLLGRIGWLDRIRLGLIDHDGELYLARTTNRPFSEIRACKKSSRSPVRSGRE